MPRIKMPSIAPQLAQSESKARFFDRLALSEGDRMHRHLYALMKAEAVEGWARVTANRDALAPQFRDDLSIEPPYSFSQVNELAIQQEVIKIYDQARPETKIIYRLGLDQDSPQEENWIIRWLLWHVFRYRDERNSSSNRKSSNAKANSNNQEQIEDISSSSGTSAAMAVASAILQHRPLSHDADLPTQPSNHHASSRYWDPVRDDFRS